MFVTWTRACTLIQSYLDVKVQQLKAFRNRVMRIPLRPAPICSGFAHLSTFECEKTGSVQPIRCLNSEAAGQLWLCPSDSAISSLHGLLEPGNVTECCKYIDLLVKCTGVARAINCDEIGCRTAGALMQSRTVCGHCSDLPLVKRLGTRTIICLSSYACFYGVILCLHLEVIQTAPRIS